jgi:hypothetical protein
MVLGVQGEVVTVVANDGKSISQGLSKIRLLTIEKLYCKKNEKNLNLKKNLN